MRVQKFVLGLTFVSVSPYALAQDWQLRPPALSPVQNSSQNPVQPLQVAPLVQPLEEFQPDAQQPSVVLPEAVDAELIQSRYENGKTQVERWVTLGPTGDYINHGSYKEFARDGNVISAGEFQMGLRQGEWFQLIDASQAEQLAPGVTRAFQAPFKSKANFERGILVKHWVLDDAQGRPVFIWGFKDGQRHGDSIWFNAKGDILTQLRYRTNEVHGPAIVNSAAKNVEGEMAFQDGYQRKQNKDWYTKNGQRLIMKSQETVLVPSEFNLQSHDWKNNRVDRAQPKSVESLRDGRATYFHPNGQRSFDGQYKLGARSGAFIWWYANGQQQTVGEFKQDQPVGSWTWWHQNGMKKTVGQFDDGSPSGTWLSWSPEGQLLERTPADQQRLAERKGGLQSNSGSNK